MKLAFDVDKFVTMVQSIAPELWEHVCKLTQSVNERKGRSASVKETSFAGHIKHLRRAYLVSLILFITSSECNFPFHVVLSDIIESCGGSTELITILNRFGIVSSVETLKRTILLVSQDRKAAGVKSLLVDKAFTVASADNVDFLQSNAAVYAGNQHRSWYARWHATSIQLVQPMPKTAVHSAQSIPRRRLFTSVGEVSSSDSIESSSLRSMSQPSIESNPGKQLRSVLSRKRQEHSSPLNSPSQSTRSPHSKRACTSKLRSRNVSDVQAELIRRPHVSVANERPILLCQHSILCVCPNFLFVCMMQYTMWLVPCAYVVVSAVCKLCV